ncbi:hypothetical protein SVIOM342S_00363 [Streptomyces violaceorubidus]
MPSLAQSRSQPTTVWRRARLRRRARGRSRRLPCPRVRRRAAAPAPPAVRAVLLSPQRPTGRTRPRPAASRSARGRCRTGRRSARGTCAASRLPANPAPLRTAERGQLQARVARTDGAGVVRGGLVAHPRGAVAVPAAGVGGPGRLGGHGVQGGMPLGRGSDDLPNLVGQDAPCLEQGGRGLRGAHEPGALVRGLLDAQPAGAGNILERSMPSFSPPVRATRTFASRRIMRLLSTLPVAPRAVRTVRMPMARAIRIASRIFSPSLRTCRSGLARISAP